MCSNRLLKIEADRWSNYHTYLVIFLSINLFFGLFTLTFSGFILNRMAISFSWNSSDLLLIFSIIGFGGLLTILPRYFVDLHGRKPLFFFINIIFYLMTIGSAFASNTLFFIIFQFIANIFAIDLYSIILSEEIPSKHRGKSIGIASGIGMTCAILAGYLFTFSGQSVEMWRYLYGGVSLIGLIIFILFWLKMKETRRYIRFKKKKKQALYESKSDNNENSNRNGHLLTKQSIFRIFKKKYLKILLLSSLIVFLTDWIYLTIKRYFIIFLMEERVDLGFNEPLIGSWSMLIYLGSIFGYYISGYSADKLGRKKSLYISVVIYFISSLFFLFVWNISVIFISLFFINFSYAIFRLIAEILAVVFFPTKLRASGSGWIFLFAGISSILGNFVMFYFLDLVGEWSLMFFIVGTICLVALVTTTFFIPETNGRTVEEIYQTEIENNGH
ncbi:MAG: nitrate/nitrite transporter [Promethearchaeota archaeon]